MSNEEKQGSRLGIFLTSGFLILPESMVRRVGRAHLF
jgi:hypothetical protein